MLDWFKDCIVYQIFPDLFNPCCQENEVPLGYYGGTIKGITQKLDYIKNLGFNAIYINPIFKAKSSHRYNVLDFFQIDSILGTSKDFDELIKEAHHRGIKIILDIPFNHVSDNHPFFIDVLKNENSKYKNFFLKRDGKYQRWRGSDLVELNLDDEDVKRYLFTSKNSVLKYWIRKGIDGIRLDCANDIGIEILKLIVREAKKVKKDILIMGEVFNYAEDWSYVLDSLQSYYLTGILFSLIRGEISLSSFSNAYAFVYERYRFETLLNSLNILSSHDTPRILDVFPLDLRIYNILLAIQFTFPGVPVVLYGEEVGLKKGENLSRVPMVWDESRWNKDILALYKKFINLRKMRVELRRGKFLDFSSLSDYRILSYLRYTEKRHEFSIILINHSDKDIELKVFIPYSHLHDAIRLYDIFSDDKFLCEISAIKVKMEPYQVRVLLPEPEYIEGYTFFKRH
jgi:glycosidase